MMSWSGDDDVMRWHDDEIENWKNKNLKIKNRNIVSVETEDKWFRRTETSETDVLDEEINLSRVINVNEVSIFYFEIFITRLRK